MSSLTLAQLAAHYTLPPEVLTQAGCRELVGTGVAFPVFDGLEEVGLHIRASLGGNGRAPWFWSLADKERRTPFGAHRLAEMKAWGDYPLLIAESDVDAAVCQHLGFPAIASGGVSMWRAEWWPLIQEGGFQYVAVWVEPEGGEKLLTAVLRSAPEGVKVHFLNTLSWGAKDAARLYKTLDAQELSGRLLTAVEEILQGRPQTEALEVPVEQWPEALDAQLVPRRISASGDREAACLFCGDDSHLSYHPERGFHCWKCDVKGSSVSLGALVGLVKEADSPRIRFSTPIEKGSVEKRISEGENTPSASPSEKRILAITGAALAEETQPDTLPWLPLCGQEGYIGPGLTTLISSLPKGGKSTLLFWGIQDWLAQGKRVIVLSEEPRSLLKARVHDLGLASDNLLLCFLSGLPWEETFAWLREQAADVLVIDTLRSWGLTTDENDASLTSARLVPLQAWAREKNLALVWLHHLRKSGGEEGMAHSGTTAIVGAADVAVEIHRVPHGEGRRLLRAVSRWTQTPAEALVELRPEGYAALGSPAAVSAEELENRVLEIAESLQSPLTLDGWVETLEEPRPAKEHLRRVLKELAAAGRLSQTGAGKRNDPHLWGPIHFSTHPSLYGVEKRIPPATLPLEAAQ